MLKEIIIAVQSYFQAHRFISENKLWKWILIPGIVYAILFVAGIYLFWESSAFVIDFLLTKTGVKSWLQKGTSLLKFLLVFGQIVVHIILMVLYFSWFKYLFLIVGSPVFAWLSEKTETLITGSDYPFRFRQFVKDALRGTGIALRNTLWQTVYSVSVFFLALIPVVGWATPVLALFIECYYFGFSMLDYTSERKGLTTSQSIHYIGNHKGLAIGNGLVFYLLHLIPLVGWVMAPGYAVIAATLSLQQENADHLIVQKVA